MSTSENVQVMMKIFSAIERRDPQGVFALCQPDVEFHWPPSLPYGGSSPASAWADTWVPCSRPRQSGAWIRGWLRRARRRWWSSGTSGE